MINDTFAVCADVARIANNIPSTIKVQDEELRSVILARTDRISNILERIALDPYVDESRSTKQFLCEANRELNTLLTVINGITNA